jgi:hypothetical protein
LGLFTTSGAPFFVFFNDALLWELMIFLMTHFILNEVDGEVEGEEGKIMKKR